MSDHGLPGLLGEIAEVAGLAAALAIADAKGGTQVDIPRRARSDHWLVRLVGQETADRICDHFTITDADGRTRGARGVMIPRGPMGLMAKAKRRLADELRAGTSVREAALRSGLSERTAWTVKKALGSDPNQISIFDILPPDRG